MEQLPDTTSFATTDDLLALRFEFGERFDQIDDRFHQLHLAMHGMFRTFVIAQVTTMFGAVGLFFGINQLI
jgi:hypothetical protein